MAYVWDILRRCGEWILQLPWGEWRASFAQMTIPEWASFLASIAAIVAFFIGIPRLRSFHYIQRYRTFVELYKLNEQLISRLRANDVALPRPTAKRSATPSMPTVLSFRNVITPTSMYSGKRRIPRHVPSSMPSKKKTPAMVICRILRNSLNCADGSMPNSKSYATYPSV